MKKEELAKVYEKLIAEDEIKYGHTIYRETLGRVFGTTKWDSWDYIDPLLNFKAFLEQEMGMFCTTEKGDLIIAAINDAPEYSKRRRNRADRLDLRTKRILEALNYKAMNSQARCEAMLEKRLLDIKLRNSRLVMREVEYYEIAEDEKSDDDE